MDFVAVGRSGLKVSRIALGGFSFGDPAWQSWVLSEEQARPILARAIHLGINFIDTADMYSNGVSEEIIGRTWPNLIRREELVLSTKAFHPTGPGVNERGLSRKHLFDAVDGSLRRLRTDYVDLYQMHRTDHTTPIEETLEALSDIVRAGKARYWGVSNLMAWQLMRILAICDRHGWVRPICIQNHYNLAYREEEREMLPLCRLEGVGYTPWSPLARGFLAGKPAGETVRGRADSYRTAYFGDPGDLAVLDAAVACASRHGCSTAEVALAWMLKKPGVTAPVIGATKVEHVDSAVRALTVALDDDDLAGLEAPYQPHRVMLHL